jgi:hypothetical protein
MRPRKHREPQGLQRESSPCYGFEPFAEPGEPHRVEGFELHRVTCASKVTDGGHAKRAAPSGIRNPWGGLRGNSGAPFGITTLILLTAIRASPAARPIRREHRHSSLQQDPSRARLIRPGADGSARRPTASRNGTWGLRRITRGRPGAHRRWAAHRRYRRDDFHLLRHRRRSLGLTGRAGDPCGSGAERDGPTSRNSRQYDGAGRLEAPKVDPNGAEDCARLLVLNWPRAWLTRFSAPGERRAMSMRRPQYEYYATRPSSRKVHPARRVVRPI